MSIPHRFRPMQHLDDDARKELRSTIRSEMTDALASVTQNGDVVIPSTRRQRSRRNETVRVERSGLRADGFRFDRSHRLPRLPVLPSPCRLFWPHLWDRGNR